MSSELHNRLEYLVNYSSQLIFVSGDSIAEQQRTLESFVFQQPENTELAYLTAESSLAVTDYRGALCKQLLGQVVGSYVRPLNELLADLNHHDGPILITITQAEHLDNEFLQELWDLVLQSRFANNKQHLNVLLFGESRWAEKAKQWLPAKNTDTPLLISSQSVSVESYSSDVDKLLAERRAAFERYRQQRGQLAAPATKNRLRSPWLWMGIFGVFVSSFIAVLGWQYGETLSTLFNPIETNDTLNQPALIEPEQTLTESAETISVPISSAFTQPGIQNASELDTTNSVNSEQRVVQSFDEALRALPPAIRKGNEQLIAQDQAEANETTPVDSNNATPASTSSIATDNIGASTIANTPTVLIPSTSLVNDSLINEIGDGYWIQLAGMKDLQLAQNFLLDHDIADKVSVYSTQRYGGDWFVLLWTESAPTLVQARAMIERLPNYPGRNNAFVKSAVQIKAELEVAK